MRVRVFALVFLVILIVPAVIVFRGSRERVQQLEVNQTDHPPGIEASPPLSDSVDTLGFRHQSPFKSFEEHRDETNLDSISASEQISRGWSEQAKIRHQERKVEEARANMIHLMEEYSIVDLGSEMPAWAMPPTSETIEENSESPIIFTEEPTHLAESVETDDDERQKFRHYVETKRIYEAENLVLTNMRERDRKSRPTLNTGKP